MIPTLLDSSYIDSLTYPGKYITFPKHGYVDLVDTIECKAVQTEDDSSEWELELTYPADGPHLKELENDKIILVKANSWQGLQAFRIYSVKKATNKTVKVAAQHISYDMANHPVKPFSVKNSSGKKDVASKAVSKLMTSTIEFGDDSQLHHFSIETNVDERTQDIGKNPTEFKFDTPDSMRAVLLDGEDSIKGKFGGDLVIDNFYIQLLLVGGEDRDITITYGVDLVDLEQEKNNTELVTHVVGYYKKHKGDSDYGSTPIKYGDIIKCVEDAEYKVNKTIAVDLTEYFNKAPDKTALNKKTREYIQAEQLGEPKVSLTLTYAMLGQDVRMHDAIRIRFPKLGIDTKAKVVKYTYDVLLERCEEVDVGKAKDSAYFSLLDASRLKRGLIPPKRIQNGSIGGGKIAIGGINTDHIEDDAIDHNKLAGLAVNTGHLAAGAVTGAKVATGQNGITTKNIVDNAVTKEKVDEELRANIMASTAAVIGAITGAIGLLDTRVTNLENQSQGGR